MSSVRIVDVRSDTITKPTPQMRQAMHDALVGDDQYGEDPTVNELEKLAAHIFGKEEACFVPSGTMGNIVSVMAHSWQRGQEIIIGDICHINLYEQGNVAQVANVHHRTVKNELDGTFCLDTVKQYISTSDSAVHFAKTSAICIENTQARCMGAPLPMDFVEKVGGLAKSNNLKLHVDGARIFNTSIALGLPAAEIVKDCDSVSSCLSKGLGCPAGNMVAGSKDFIMKVRRSRQTLGGAMRQAGVLAATGILALKTMVNRLADDHVNARTIAEAIGTDKDALCSIDLNRVKTNILLVDVNPNHMSPAQFVARLDEVTEREREVLGEENLCRIKARVIGGQIRMLTHLDVSAEDAKLAAKKIKYLNQEQRT